MDFRKMVLKETGIVALGEAVCTGVMFAVFALLGKFDSAVLVGGALGAVLAVANFFFMAIGTSLAADKAEAQDVKGGVALVRGSYILRTAVLAVVLFACAKSGIANVLALALPLLFVRPTLTVAEFFKKKGA